MKRNLLPAVFLLVLCAFSYGSYYEIFEHSIEIDVDEAGNGSVKEQFFLRFSDSNEVREFKEKSLEIGVDLEAWREFDGNFQPYMGNIEDVTNVTVSFEEGEGARFLLLDYDLRETMPAMAKTNETSRLMEFSINKQIFRKFETGELWIIPQGTEISFILPEKAEIETPVPEADIFGNKVVWEGYKSTNVLKLNYIIYKQIAPTFEVSQFFAYLFGSDTGRLVIMLIIAVSVAVYWKRKSISGRIENFIVKNSDLGPASEEEEQGAA